MILHADFHLHSCLSPCGDLTMSPELIARMLHIRGISIAALTDHNSALNCPAFASACKKYGIAPLFGMEVQTSEEVHILTLFASLQTALDFSDEIYRLLPPVMNNPEKAGDQVYVDDQEDIIGEVDKHLITSADISIDDLASRVHALHGIVIPAHADRPAFSLTSQLGFIPDGEWDAIEVVRRPAEQPVQPRTVIVNGEEIVYKGTPPVDTRGYPLTTSSDAHYPEHIARRPFDLDIQDMPLFAADGSVDIVTVLTAIRNLPA